MLSGYGVRGAVAFGSNEINPTTLLLTLLLHHSHQFDRPAPVSSVSLASAVLLVLHHSTTYNLLSDDSSLVTVIQQ